MRSSTDVPFGAHCRSMVCTDLHGLSVSLLPLPLPVLMDEDIVPIACRIRFFWAL